MKTLIINGSPRRNGDTSALVSELAKCLEGEVRIVDMRDDISPCIDCRYCWEKPGCAINDGMQEVYEYLLECDNVVLASPIWFSSLSGPLLNITSRFQTNFMGRFRRGEKIPADKNGVLILVGGQAGTETGPEKSALMILRNMYVSRENVTVIKSMDTDNVPAAEDAAALEMIRTAAKKLNAKNGGAAP